MYMITIFGVNQRKGDRFSMKKLPITYSNQPSGECWTFYKFAILKSYTIAEPWLATHIEFYINENMCGGYGNADCDYYRMCYYSDILSMARIPVSEITADTIIHTLCNEIDKEHYIVLYLDFNQLHGKQGVFLHELLIYGYNKEKGVFYCPRVYNGAFKEVEISFDALTLAYKSSQEYYLQDGWKLLSKRSYYFGITSISMRHDYKNDNFIADYIDKLDHEIHGRQIVQTDLSVNNLKDRVCYTGTACFKGLSNCIKTYISNNLTSEILIKRMIRTMKMMYDYRILFLSSMDWFVVKIGGDVDSKFIKIRNQYKECSIEVQRNYIMLCKYLQTANIHLLESVELSLNILYSKEIEILSEYRELIFPYYYMLNGVPMPVEE